jgi:predicted metal-dependent phosphoesterase TrpH
MTMMPLKVDLHIHTKEDKEDRISYSSYELIDEAVLRGFDAIAITNHETLTYTRELESYATARGIVLIPGVEAVIRGKHILLINMPFQDNSYNSFQDILGQKAADNLVIAPHPYFPGSTSLDGHLEAIPHLFDAIEYSHFYARWINFNRQAIRFAHKHRLPVLATSDAHTLDQFGLAYSLVEAEKNPDAIIQAIKAGRVKAVSRPLPVARLIRIFVRVARTKCLSWKGLFELSCTGAAFGKDVLKGRL